MLDSKLTKEKKTWVEQINDESDKQDVKPKCYTAVRGFANYSDCPRCSTLKKDYQSFCNHSEYYLQSQVFLELLELVECSSQIKQHLH